MSTATMTMTRSMARAKAERRILGAHTEQRYRRLPDTSVRVSCQCGWKRDVISRRAAGDAVVEHKREQLRRVELEL